MHKKSSFIDHVKEFESLLKDYKLSPEKLKLEKDSDIQQMALFVQNYDQASIGGEMRDGGDYDYPSDITGRNPYYYKHRNYNNNHYIDNSINNINNQPTPVSKPVSEQKRYYYKNLDMKICYGCADKHIGRQHMKNECPLKNVQCIKCKTFGHKIHSCDYWHQLQEALSVQDEQEKEKTVKHDQEDQPQVAATPSQQSDHGKNSGTKSSKQKEDKKQVSDGTHFINVRAIRVADTSSDDEDE